MSKKRRLRPDERELWERVARGTDPLHARPHGMAEPEVRQPISPAPKAQPDPIPAFRLGESAKPQTSSGPTSQPPLAMDRRTHDRMKRGKLRPEARLDLHGMTRDRAHSALSRFILDAHGRGRRLVLVITGKGRDRDEGGPIPVRPGILRHSVPQWLSLPPLRSAVLQVTPAHIRHGGAGAYYVYLRRGPQRT
ncbi:DNA-nicking endonuclease, Smr domain [Poseidonocella pacifica]|uniref:DNA-nicking endonuclease, Smr domain n=1 Tax=Poseidonocella pacifica TaxID=871651 RepID=A0A1I0XWE5_9RHOB|nr:Smr/MutS family protein [Poseidonocella pacifica]SFB04630.1 DNA-nicking endonuclease, Smr domain [Poseidonocella pacifica]